MNLIGQPIAVIRLGYVGLPLTVAHRQFHQAGAAGVRQWLKPQGVLCDVKHVLPRDAVDGRL